MLKTDAEVDSVNVDAGKIVIIRFCDEKRDMERILEQSKFTYFSYSGELIDRSRSRTTSVATSQEGRTEE